LVLRVRVIVLFRKVNVPVDTTECDRIVVSVVDIVEEDGRTRLLNVGATRVMNVSAYVLIRDTTLVFR